MSMPPSLVGQKILEIAENGMWQLRHPLGLAAVSLLPGRRGMTDEQWVDLHSSDDETYFIGLQREPND